MLWVCMVRVLVTGFEIFSHHQRNISADIIRVLELKERSFSKLLSGEPVEIQWDCRILGVDEAGTRLVANEIEDGSEWEAIIQLGLCESCEFPRIEERATNSLAFRIADNSGRIIKAGTVITTGPEYWSSTSDPASWPLEELPLKVNLSQDAGTFLCNETYARTLHSIEMNDSLDGGGRKLPTLFLHLPDESRFSLTLQTQLVEIIAGWML